MKSALRSEHEKGAGESSQTAVSTEVARTKKPDRRLPAVEEAAKSSKPFGMSYGGGTTAEYLQYMINRGAR
jgi:hypothetical protein